MSRPRHDELENAIVDPRRVLDPQRQSGSLYQPLVASQPVNLYRKDINGRFTFGNTLFCRTTGKTISAGKRQMEQEKTERTEGYTGSR